MPRLLTPDQARALRTIRLTKELSRVDQAADDSRLDRSDSLSARDYSEIELRIRRFDSLCYALDELIAEHDAAGRSDTGGIELARQALSLILRERIEDEAARRRSRENARRRTA